MNILIENELPIELFYIIEQNQIIWKLNYTI